MYVVLYDFSWWNESANSHICCCIDYCIFIRCNSQRRDERTTWPVDGYVVQETRHDARQGNADVEGKNIKKHKNKKVA